ncbi:hypothetical protein ACHAWX_000968 [Stephanocyclus meneghinianus]
MPRGYLKHNKGVSRQQRRGGSSLYSPRPARTKAAIKRTENLKEPRAGSASCTCPWIKSRTCASSLNVSDFTLKAPSAHNLANSIAMEYPVGECIICFERRPLICVINQCRWHGAACRSCLHRIYVTDAQKSTKNFPLECFHPQCVHKIRVGPLAQHKIFETSEQKKNHMIMNELSIIESHKQMTVHCPNIECNFPRGIEKVTSEKWYTCKNCKKDFFVTSLYPTIRAVENLKKDSIGKNDGWAMCPSCHIIISKGHGCDHMVCGYCNTDFWWDEAQEETMKKFRRMARPPNKEIYMWWD